MAVERRWLALAVLTAARASVGFQFQSLASASPELVRDFGLGYAELGFLIGLYFLPGVVLALPGGLLGRRFGDRRIVAAGLVLMTVGGVAAGSADGHAALLVGRLLSGVGAVLLNVVMAKMVADWFAGGRHIVLAMAVFVNSFPIGVGSALLSLGALAEAAGWRAALYATAAAAFASLLLVGFAYRPHANDGRPPADAATANPGGTPISADEAALACIAGTIWGIYNGAFAIMVGFAPTLLADTELAAGTAGLVVGVASWLVVASVQAGGFIAQRWGHADVLMVVGIGSWGACLLLMPWADPVALLVIAGLLLGLPVGVIMSLPVAALRPESRSAGMGLFYTGLYVGHAGLPPLAGWTKDLPGGPAAPFLFAGAIVLAILPLFTAFRLLPRPKARTKQPG